MSATAEQRVRAVRERMARAAERSGRDPASIELVAVSKRHTLEKVQQVHQAGIRVFGENRIQEAAEKVPAAPELCWHFIGQLQRNKARKAVELFELIHAVDTLKLAETLSRLGLERGQPVRALIEINIGGEESKGGIQPADAIDFMRHVSGLEGLETRGLMTIPPPVVDPEDARPGFRELAELSRRVTALELPRVKLVELSMGMSADFEVAIEEGATLVRVGTALFGPRP